MFLFLSKMQRDYDKKKVENEEFEITETNVQECELCIANQLHFYRMNIKE